MSHTGEFLQNPIELQVRQRWFYYDANNEQNGRQNGAHEFPRGAAGELARPDCPWCSVMQALSHEVSECLVCCQAEAQTMTPQLFRPTSCFDAGTSNGGLAD
jgi:hypothetical protein